MSFNAFPPLELSATAVEQLSAAPVPSPGYAPLFDFPGGDVKVEVNYKDQKIEGKVVGPSMASASHVWAKFIYPPWVPEDSTGKSIDFSDDDGEAVLLLLRIVHFQFCKIPTKLTVGGLYQIALLCEAYDCHNLVKPWIKEWMSIKPKRVGDGILGECEFVFIAWAFGDIELFEGIARTIFKTCEQDTMCRKAERHKEGEVIFPDEFVETVITARRALIARLMAVPAQALQNFSELAQHQVQCHFRDPACDKFMYKNVVEHFEADVLWESQPEHVDISPNELLLTLLHNESVRFFSLENPSESHTICRNGTNIKEQAMRVYKDVPDLVQDCHRRHMERIAAQLEIRE